jgi:hypothetical protein
MPQLDAKTTTWRDHVYRAKYQNTPVPAVPILYLALFTADPTASGDLANEATYGGYARVAFTVTAPADGVGTNSADILFPESTSGGIAITHVGVMDSAVIGAGIMIDHIVLNSPVSIEINRSPIVQAGQGTLQEK